MARPSIASLTAIVGLIASACLAAEPAKQGSALFPSSLISKARSNIAQYEWARSISQPIVETAKPWLEQSDDQLWDLMFGPRIKRSWMVWSNGFCPACKKPVPMYNWQMDALNHPWKTRCPNCKELFPKNDFAAFHRSGLDEQGVFDPARADRALLFNTEHPGPADPMHLFGVDDGEGYVDGANRWRFIGAFLIYGQWKQAIVAGIRSLAAAYVITGDVQYAHKAGVMLDRVADLYPTFDFGKQGVMYEGPPRDGYISTWHDACVEVRDLALAYDQTFEALRQDHDLVRFLANKAKQYKLANTKSTFADIQRNIEERILRDTVEHRQKTESNYPQTDISIILCNTVLNWPANREAIMVAIDAILEKSTAVDGMTGEKGLAGYTILPPRYLAEFLGRYARVDPGFLKEVLRRHPKLHDMYRFPIDMWCLDHYYPQSGDSGSFAVPVDSYLGVTFSKNPGIDPSAADFLWQLFTATKDNAFVKVLYRSNDNSVDGLPYDLFADNPSKFQKDVRQIIQREGTSLNLASVNKQLWCLAILRSGKGPDARAAWLDYDSGERHSHHDGMNLGLFAKGLDLMPDFGYPPVQFGGWAAPRAVWYTMTAAHNTVMVDGQDTRTATGATTLWADGKRFHAIQASAPGLIGGQRYERTILMVDVSDQDFYLVDVFRVAGGTDHLKFMRSHFGSITSKDLSLRPSDAPLRVTPAMQMRGFQKDAATPPVWSVDWKIDDRRHLLPAAADVHLRYTDLTSQASAYTAESWVAYNFDAVSEAWIPTVLVHRRADKAPLTSTFVSTIEPYEKFSHIAGVRRLAVATPQGETLSDACVGLDVELTDGSHDLFILNDVADSTKRDATELVVTTKDLRVVYRGGVCWLRTDGNQKVIHVALSHGSHLKAADLEVQLRPASEFVELDFDNAGVKLCAGKREQIVGIRRDSQSIWDK